MEETAGRKIFILYPHTVIQDELLDILIMAGFESYMIHDHNKAAKLLAQFSGSIMFINIDEGMNETEWETYIRGLQESPLTRNCLLGILSYNADQAFMEKYLVKLAVPCGYVQLKSGIKESIKTMLATLEANKARGRRKFIRVSCEDEFAATVNFQAPKGTLQGSPSGSYDGKLLDISASGIAARFDSLEYLPPKSLIRGMKLNLRGSLALIDAVFMGKRQLNVYIFLFDAARMKPEHKKVVCRFIKYKLQHYIDNLIV